MKHTSWKTAAAVLASASLLFGMSACGRTDNATDGAGDAAVTSIDSEPATGDLTVWAMGNEGDLLGDFVEGFKEENPDVNITVTAIPWASAHDKIQTAIAAGTVPDVIQMGTTWMADFADTFAPVPENFDLSDFSAGPLEAGQVNGEQLGVPWYVDSHVLYYRTDIAEQAGWDHAPETLDELKQMAADVKQVDGVENGMYISPSGADSWQGTLWAFFSSGVRHRRAAHVGGRRAYADLRDRERHRHRERRAAHRLHLRCARLPARRDGRRHRRARLPALVAAGQLRVGIVPSHLRPHRLGQGHVRTSPPSLAGVAGQRLTLRRAESSLALAVARAGYPGEGRPSRALPVFIFVTVVSRPSVCGGLAAGAGDRVQADARGHRGVERFDHVGDRDAGHGIAGLAHQTADALAF